MSSIKLLFIHSGEKVRADTEGNLYTDGCYDDSVWNRYRSISDSISIIMRKESVPYSPNDAQQRFNKIPDDLSFYAYPNCNKSICSYLSPSVRRAQKKLLSERIRKTDIVIIRMPGTEYALKEALRQQKQVLVEAVGCPWDALWNHSVYGKLLAAPAFFRMRRSIWKAPYVMYVTNQFLQHRYPTAGKSIGCSDVALLDTDKKILARRIEKIKKHKGKCIIGTTAAIDVRYKGQAYVIRALGLLKKQGNTDFEYQLVGGGSNQYLKQVAEKANVLDQIHFLGALSHESVFRWLDSIDIYVQPSRTEGMPRALLEAMSRALPCIGSDVGGIPELLEASAICKIGKRFSATLAKKLTELDKNSMTQQVRRNFHIAQTYSREALTQKRKAFFQILVQDAFEDELYFKEQ